MTSLNPKICPTPLVSSTRSLFAVTPHSPAARRALHYRKQALCPSDRGIQKKQDASAALHIRLDRGEDWRNVIEPRTAHQQHRAVLRNLRLLHQRDGARLVIVLFESVLQIVVAFAARIVEAMFAAAADRADGARATLQRADDRARDLFFGQRLRFFAPLTGIDDVAP